MHEQLIQGFADRLDGELVRPGDPSYDARRAVWNGSIDRRPALIARCATAADVVRSVSFAGANGLLVALRGGGHSFPGHSVCDGGIVIDLSQMNDVRLNLDAGTVKVQAGALLGELDAATQPHGLAVPAGIVTHTGVAGLTLGGGLGWLQRKYGLAIDQLVSAELVTADGSTITASAGEHPELFWGLRGGGGNFGVVTEFEFRLNPVGPTVLAGPVYWPMERSDEVLRFYRDWVADAPDDLMTIVVHRHAPAVEWMPSELHGRPVVAVVCCWLGDIAEGERRLRSLRAFGPPLVDVCAPRPFLELQSMFDASYPHGWWYYMRSCDVSELTDDIIDITVDHAHRITSPVTAFPIWQLGGAMSRVADEDTVFNGRSAAFTFNVTAASVTEDGFEVERDWVRAFWSDLEPHHTSVYVNFLMDEGDDRIRQAYGEHKFDRLAALKAEYDPENLFRLNHNIPRG
ncbi:FAD-binding oxidoreductase [Agromyces bauzanensis]